MLISLSSRAFSLPSTHSLGTFIKHLPTLKPSSLKFNPISIHKTTRALSSASAPAADGGGVHSPHFDALTSHQKHQIHAYIDCLLQWNQKMNLTAVKEENEVMERHVEDSLAIIDPIRSSYLSHCGKSLENMSVVDVGSGAGLPGLILAIACPGWKVALLESMNKRCVFLENSVWDGLFVAAKGHDPQEEVARAEKAIRLMGASLLQTCSVESHSKYGQRTAVICLKDGSTPKKYPRPPGLDLRTFALHLLCGSCICLYIPGNLLAYI
ncbi:S-adenosyl-L-methionine-dependent methyltransferase superfamily protein [Forsythia ovata]|uniref:S-adenosyl-L-methionine-dependent methyltransferase superfamily protein n=1 Tax=Forsythia ovata TaxID=205694 RepID=A0ABD1TTN5_9LAMI